jgi:hypothetical protein
MKFALTFDLNLKLDRETDLGCFLRYWFAAVGSYLLSTVYEAKVCFDRASNKPKALYRVYT